MNISLNSFIKPERKNIRLLKYHITAYREDSEFQNIIDLAISANKQKVNLLEEQLKIIIKEDKRSQLKVRSLTESQENYKKYYETEQTERKNEKINMRLFIYNIIVIFIILIIGISFRQYSIDFILYIFKSQTLNFSDLILLALPEIILIFLITFLILSQKEIIRKVV